MILNLKMWPTEVRVQKSDILGATHWKERVSSENSFCENIQAPSFLSGIIWHKNENIGQQTYFSCKLENGQLWYIGYRRRILVLDNLR